MNIQALNGRQVRFENQTYLYFAGTSYLGIPTHPVFQEWVIEGFSRFGSNYGGSRRSDLKFDVIAQAEDRLAKLTGQEAALTYSSGTLAAQALIQSLAQTHQLVYTPDAHPALWQGGRQINSGSNWQEQLIHQVRRSELLTAIICNGIDPLEVKTYDFSWWQELPKNRSTIIVLDESHALGIVGDEGAGSGAEWEVPEQVELMLTASLAKAFGVPGGVVLGTQKRMEELAARALFGGASPIVPAYLFAFLNAQELYRQQLQKLRALIGQLQESEVASSDLSWLPNYPVFKVKRTDIADQLRAQHLLISSFHYPTSDSPRLSRIVLNATHEADDIANLIAALKNM